jgi:hypothetical protein
MEEGELAVKRGVAMRCLSKLSSAGALTAMLVALVLCGLSGTVTGCNDDAESEMMQQMMSAGGGSSSSSSAPDRTTKQPSTEMAVAGAAGEQEPQDDGGEEEVEAPQPIENITIEEVEIDAPYPEFTGEGRYDVKVYCMLKEFEEAQVYRIAALDEEGNEVGSQEKHLKLPLKKARSFNFNEFYCTSMPVTVAFFRTDKEAVAADATEDSSGGARRGAAGGGTSSDDEDDPGGSVGRGVAGGGGS